MKNFMGSRRFLAIYSGILTLAFAVTIFGGFARNTSKSTFDEIDVHRINVVEPDGTLRLVISNKSSFPGIIIKGKEHPHPNRKTAGMLFFNDEGTENGGLIFGGMKDKKGKVSSYGHLSFDAYEQDQVFTIDAGQEGDNKSVALGLIDRPSYPIGEMVALMDRVKDLSEDERKREIEKFSRSHELTHTRLSLGRGNDKSVALKLKDVEGRDRIVIEVAPDGSPALRFLDPNGKVISRLPESAGK